MYRRILDGVDAVRKLRHDIHAHPELAFEEFRTADRVASELADLGIAVHRGLAGTGVVGVLQAGRSLRAIGLRADMDALPIHEINHFDHASRYPGKMHACGHDGHTAMLLGAARYLAEHGDFDGTVYFIFQPAEEGSGGADVMIKDGLFERFPMQNVFGMHNWPGMAAGCFAVGSGPVMAAFSSFRIVICGRGCHAALPHLGADPLPVAAQLVLALQTIVSRNAHPLESAVLSVTTIQAGTATNVIADTCELTGTVRTFSQTMMSMIETRMSELASHICAAHAMRCDFEFTTGYPATINEPAAAELARQVMTGIVGDERVLVQQPTMGAEDFAYMLQRVPGCYVLIGSGDGEHRHTGHGEGPCTLHNASYDFNDDILALGIAYWVRLVETALNR
ncbi:MAG: amidohydrolase [Methylomonas sp.]|nr:amidohydrolase [Methylomonas sp.]PPD20389.1 MAG: amidohydrolase [Methylomonas sp.]PPD24882.1 MAG: amidohydrolase [Methylomonas sp.]PPD33751.1 MAG: amidohydrolase [Methylomonas sp.]PPD40540.1 MAG: amidohydrolase [Methylomonas sp.]